MVALSCNVLIAGYNIYIYLNSGLILLGIMSAKKGDEQFLFVTYICPFYGCSILQHFNSGL
jgi:hypothetical protein